VEMSRFGQKGLLICDPFVFEKLLPDFRQKMEEVMEIGSELIVGMGGGKTLDTTKAVSHELKVPACIVPTIASTDAPCSALSVIYTPEGKFKRYLILPRNPDLAESCKKKYAKNMTGDVGSMTAYALARVCYKTLLEYGVAAKLSCQVHAVTPALEHIVEVNTLLSGLGFESGGLAAAHAIHNGLTVLEQTHKYYHGEKVAVGTLASLFLTDKPKETIDEVFSFCESVSLPTTLADIGLSAVSDEELMKVAEAACAEGETIHNEPVPVTPEMVFSALKAADVEGKRRKKI